MYFTDHRRERGRERGRKGGAVREAIWGSWDPERVDVALAEGKPRLELLAAPHLFIWGKRGESGAGGGGREFQSKWMDGDRGFGRAGSPEAGRGVAAPLGSCLLAED